MKTLTCTLTLALLLAVGTAQAAPTNFTEDFDTDQAVSAYAGWSSGTLDLGSGATISEPAASGSIASATIASGDDGFAFSTFDTGSFTLQDGNLAWNVSGVQTLGFNTGRDWSGTDSGGPEAGYMIILAATDSDLSQGDGYYVSAVGNNEIGLYRYTGGVHDQVGGSVTKILTGSYVAGTTAHDLQVTYDAGTDTWAVLAADAGNVLVAEGSVVDSTFTSSTMVASGFGFNGFAGGGASGRGGQLDSIELVPEPTTMALLGLGGLVALKRRRTA
jgi:hypothetical protein